MAQPSQTWDNLSRWPSNGDSDERSPSLTLWMDGLPPGITDAGLAEIFKPLNALECIITHPGSSYAFIYFSSLEDATAARETIQGALVRGSTIKIGFASPPKPVRQLWIGGISSYLTKEQLEDQFSMFGKIEECRLFRDRNSACIHYRNLDDAIIAQKILNGKNIAGNQIFVDFQRSELLREDRPDHRSSESLKNPDGIRNSSASVSQHNSKRLHYQGGRAGQPSKVLWIGYPPSVLIDEWRVLEAMQLYGEVVRVTCFSTRNYCVVEFRNLLEACHAEESLGGLLFGDPSIHVCFSNSEYLSQHKDNDQSLSLGHSSLDNIYNPNLGDRTRPCPSRTSSFFDPREPKRPRHSLLYAYSHGDTIRDLVGSQSHYSSITHGIQLSPPRQQYFWSGVIAKGGSAVCRAQCTRVGEGIIVALPEIVDCSARARLDKLAEHYQLEAIGFELVYFLPDREEDSLPFTEFLNFLRLKKRAGVADLGDGTAMFLVPPSDFISKVLKITLDDDHLYGVVLTYPDQPADIPENVSSSSYCSNYPEQSTTAWNQLEDNRRLGENSVPGLMLPSSFDDRHYTSFMAPAPNMHGTLSLSQTWRVEHQEAASSSTQNVPFYQPEQSMCMSNFQDHFFGSANNVSAIQDQSLNNIQQPYNQMHVASQVQQCPSITDEEYRLAVQFAADILYQIGQKHQANVWSGQGAGNN